MTIRHLSLPLEKFAGAVIIINNSSKNFFFAEKFS
jgi:hypothetical protein